MKRQIDIQVLYVLTDQKEKDISYLKVSVDDKISKIYDYLSSTGQSASSLIYGGKKIDDPDKITFS